MTTRMLGDHGIVTSLLPSAPSAVLDVFVRSFGSDLVREAQRCESLFGVPASWAPRTALLESQPLLGRHHLARMEQRTTQTIGVPGRGHPPPLRSGRVLEKNLI